MVSDAWDVRSNKSVDRARVSAVWLEPGESSARRPAWAEVAASSCSSWLVAGLEAASREATLEPLLTVEPIVISRRAFSWARFRAACVRQHG